MKPTRVWYICFSSYMPPGFNWSFCLFIFYNLTWLSVSAHMNFVVCQRVFDIIRVMWSLLLLILNVLKCSRCLSFSIIKIFPPFLLRINLVDFVRPIGKSIVLDSIFSVTRASFGIAVFQFVYIFMTFVIGFLKFDIGWSTFSTWIDLNDGNGFAIGNRFRRSLCLVMKMQSSMLNFLFSQQG